MIDDLVDNESATRPLLLDEHSKSNHSTHLAIPPPSLSLSLRIIYGLDGFNLAVPMTALLYLVNERVQIPVSLLPSYAAFAFLPCSFKPMYAALSNVITERFGVPRHHQIAVLLTLSSAACAAYALIPPHKVVLCFVVAFVRCLWASWPEFLFGLTLIDEAVAYETRKRQHGRHAASRQGGKADSYAETAALFQSQSATARSWGCVIANVLVLAFFAVLQLIQPLHPHRSDDTEATKRMLTESSNVLNYSTMTILILMAAGSNLVGAVIAWTCRIGEACSIDSSEGSFVLQSPSIATDQMRPPQESLTMGGLPSYDSLCYHDPLGALEMETAKQQLPNLEKAPRNTEHDSLVGSDMVQPTTQSAPYVNIGLVVLLQGSAIVFTMRQPVIHASSVLCWNVLAFLSVFLLLTVGLAGFAHSTRFGRITQQSASDSISRRYGVGLFLCLRQAIPSVSYLMSSYLFTVFVRMPWFLQVLSLWEMCVTTAACWTYGKYFSKYSRGRQLQCLIVGTTILAAAVSLGNVALIRVLDPERSYFSWTVKIGLTIAVKTLLGFTSEWKFLPDLVLATVSVDAMASTNASTRDSFCTHESSGVDTCSTLQLSAEATNGKNEYDEQSHALRPPSKSVGMHYGILISCIDFGGQLGALLAGPLVALVGTTRDNDWAHLDWLQVVNAAMMLLSLGLLVLLTPLRRDESLDS